MIRLICAFLILSTSANADTVVASRTIPAKSIIAASDLVIDTISIPGVVSDPSDIIGMEARVALYAGRPIRQADVGFPAVVERNQIIALLYSGNGLMISTEGRALGRAGPGDIVRVMNLSSRATVMARVGADGVAYVHQ
jgi:flagella basal body P-ring formation protein FlgA